MRNRPNCLKKVKKYLQIQGKSCILSIAVALIAMKREVAAFYSRFSVERMSS